MADSTNEGAVPRETTRRRTRNETLTVKRNKWLADNGQLYVVRTVSGVTVTGQSRWFERRSAPRYDYLVASRQKITRQMAKEAVARFKALGALRDWEHVAPELAKGLTGDASAGADLYWTPLDRRLLGLSTEGL